MSFTTNHTKFAAAPRETLPEFRTDPDGTVRYCCYAAYAGLGHDDKCPARTVGKTPGNGLPDWPEDLTTFAERKAYQRGVADGERVATRPSGALTFNEFRVANRERCLKWHPHGIESWSDSDWMTAIMGELGELAGLIKMRNRERDGLPGNKFSPTNEQIAKEAADVFTYLDLFCERNGIDLGLSAAEKFNEVSERVGFPDRIEVRK
jgi:NTP pyrophosphatase (non-canonical NTP hydrolase)